MELWATGFNAWGNFDFDDDKTPGDWHDLPRFLPVLRDDRINVKALYKSGTLVETSLGLKSAGNDSEFKKLAVALNGTANEPWPIAVTVDGKIAALTLGSVKQLNYLEDDDQSYRDREGDDLESKGSRKRQIFDDFDDLVIELVANISSFAALTAAGTVYTWGDDRTAGRLGREVSNTSPADIPCIVEDLHTLPDKVIRISSGGTLMAALTSDHDVYVWGNGVITGPLSQLWRLTPYPLDLDGQEFLDVAVGNQHIIVLTTQHKVLVIGANSSGQLGLSERHDHEEWTEISLHLTERQYVTRVYAGYNNSLLLVEKA